MSTPCWWKHSPAPSLSAAPASLQPHIMEGLGRGGSPGRTFRKSLFHTVSLMSAWCRPGLKEMGLKAPSESRACWSSGLGSKVHSDDGAAHPSTPALSSMCRSNQPSPRSEDRALERPIMSPHQLLSGALPPSQKHSTSVALKGQVWDQQHHITWALLEMQVFLGPTPDLLLLLLLSHFSRVRLYATPWTATHQAPLSTGFSRREYWSGLPFPSP